MRTLNGSGSRAPKRFCGVDGTGVSTVTRSLVSATSNALAARTVEWAIASPMRVAPRTGLWPPSLSGMEVFCCVRIDAIQARRNDTDGD